MDILKIISVGVVGGILAVTVKEYKPELGICIAMATGIIIFAFSARGIAQAFEDIRIIMEGADVDKTYFEAVLKVTGIAYITQYGAEICRDCGHNSIAVKVEFAGKICVILLTIPIIRAFLQACMEAVRLVW